MAIRMRTTVCGVPPPKGVNPLSAGGQSRQGGINPGRPDGERLRFSDFQTRSDLDHFDLGDLV